MYWAETEGHPSGWPSCFLPRAIIGRQIWGQGSDIYFDLDTSAKIAAPLITLVGGAIIKHYTEGKAKVISYLG